MGAVAGVAGVVVATGVSTWLSSTAEAKVTKARVERDNKVTTQREITSVLKNVEIDLNMFEMEKKGLVSSTVLSKVC
jgi:hypothetical protein